MQWRKDFPSRHLPGLSMVEGFPPCAPSPPVAYGGRISPAWHEWQRIGGRISPRHGRFRLWLSSRTGGHVLNGTDARGPVAWQLRFKRAWRPSGRRGRRNWCDMPQVPWRGLPGPVHGPVPARCIRRQKREWWKNFPWYGHGGSGKASVGGVPTPAAGSGERRLRVGYGGEKLDCVLPLLCLRWHLSGIGLGYWWR